MKRKDQMERYLRLYREGTYLDGELFLLLARNTSPEDVDEVLSRVPDDLSRGFRTWVRRYVLEGGIPVGNVPVPMPARDVMIRFKEAVDRGN